MCSCFIGYGSVVERQLHFAFVSRRFNIQSVCRLYHSSTEMRLLLLWEKEHIDIYLEENMNIMLDIAVCECVVLCTTGQEEKPSVVGGGVICGTCYTFARR